MLQHLKGYQKSITLIKTGRLNKKQHKYHKLTTIFTVRLHVMQRTVLLSEFCLSVCPSVRQMRVL